MVFNAVTQTVLIAALGASAFIAFAVPLSLHSSPRHMIGGYIVGLASGCLMGFLNNSLHLESAALAGATLIIFGAFAMSTAMFVMVVTRTEHPPAAALALGLVLNEWNLLTLAVILAGVIGLSLVKRMVLPMLMDLV
jgi:CBS-domain-containing membrane protein